MRRLKRPRLPNAILLSHLPDEKFDLDGKVYVFRPKPPTLAQQLEDIPHVVVDLEESN